MNNDVMSLDFQKIIENVEGIKVAVNQVKSAIDELTGSTDKLISGGGWTGEDASLYQQEESRFATLVDAKVSEIGNLADMLISEMELDKQVIQESDSLIEELE